MKKLVIIGLIALGCLSLSVDTNADETGCFQQQDNWIIRVYAEGTAPCAVVIAVLDTTGALVPASGIVAFSGAQCSNPCVLENNAMNDDVSLACDAGSGTAYILHDRAGQLHLTTIENLVSVQAGSPVLEVSTGAISFGSVAVGSSKSSTVTVRNTGNANLFVAAVSSPAAPFSKVADSCAGGTIAPAGTCAITIRFAPTAAIASSGNFSISSNGGNATVQLLGTGTSALPPPSGR